MRKFKSLRDAIATICREENWLLECFKLEHQTNCLRTWLYTNGAVCFEIDTQAREVYYYRTTILGAQPAEIVGID